MKKYTVAFTLLGLIPLMLSAETILSSKTTISKIYTYKSAAVVELHKTMKKNSGCTYGKSGKYIALRFNDEGSKQMFSAILSAYISNSKVRFGTSGCDSIWKSVGTMNKIYRVTLEK